LHWSFEVGTTSCMDAQQLCIAAAITVACIVVATATVLCHCNSARAVVATATVPRVERTYYLTRAQGRTATLTRARRLQLWRQAIQYITRILRTRRQWAATGRHLAQPRIQDLVSGLDRRKGQLRRTATAAVRHNNV
jgi:hypothetical protein